MGAWAKPHSRRRLLAQTKERAYGDEKVANRDTKVWHGLGKDQAKIRYKTKKGFFKDIRYI